MLNAIYDTIARYYCRLRDYRGHKGLQACVIRLNKALKLIKWRMFESHHYFGKHGTVGKSFETANDGSVDGFDY